jgi:hypothetical protein
MTEKISGYQAMHGLKKSGFYNKILPKLKKLKEEKREHWDTICVTNYCLKIENTYLNEHSHRNWESIKNNMKLIKEIKSSFKENWLITFNNVWYNVLKEFCLEKICERSGLFQAKNALKPYFLDMNEIDALLLGYSIGILTRRFIRKKLEKNQSLILKAEEMDKVKILTKNGLMATYIDYSCMEKIFNIGQGRAFKFIRDSKCCKTIIGIDNCYMYAVQNDYRELIIYLIENYGHSEMVIKHAVNYKKSIVLKWAIEQGFPCPIRIDKNFDIKYVYECGRIGISLV